MGTYRACEGTIKAGDPLVAIGEVTSWSREETANEKSYFKLGTCEEQTRAGATSRTYSIEGNFDPEDAGQDELLIGQQIEMEIYPIGLGVGDLKYTITGVVTAYSESGSGDDLITFSATIKGNTFEVGVNP